MQTQKNETTTKAAVLAQLIASRQQERDVARAEAQQQEREREEQNQQEALDHLARWAMNHISADLRQALDIDVRYDEEAAKRAEDLDDGPNPAYLTFDACGTSWKIQHDYYQFRYEYWLTSADGYRKVVTPEYSAYDITPDILDALADYPEWSATKDQREAEAREIARMRNEQREREKADRETLRIDHIHTLDHGTLGIYQRGIFGADHHVLVTIQHPGYETRVQEITGKITDQTNRWLLIVPDDENDTSYLIPQTRIIHIRPL